MPVCWELCGKLERFEVLNTHFFHSVLRDQRLNFIKLLYDFKIMQKRSLIIYITACSIYTKRQNACYKSGIFIMFIIFALERN